MRWDQTIKMEYLCGVLINFLNVTFFQLYQRSFYDMKDIFYGPDGPRRPFASKMKSIKKFFQNVSLIYWIKTEFFTLLNFTNFFYFIQFTFRFLYVIVTVTKLWHCFQGLWVIFSPFLKLILIVPLKDCYLRFF
jgi:hypothetical protein